MSQTSDYRHLANIITLTRILGVVLIFWMTPFHTLTTQLWTLIIFTVVSVTDFLDGWVARRLNIVSDIGKVLDPLADKILVLVFLPLLEMQVISSFPVFIILSREFAIMALRVVSAKNGTIIPASLSGKIKTAFTLPICGILLARVLVPQTGELPVYLNWLYEAMIWVQMWPIWWINLLIWTMVLVTIWSFLDYFGAYIWQRYVDEAGGDSDKARRSILSLVPNSVSVINLVMGLFAMRLAYLGVLELAVLLILLSTFVDAIDGRLARKLNAETTLGAKLDSKADMVSFGMTPAFIIYHVVSHFPVYHADRLGWLLGALFFVAVVYRLRRFDGSGHTDAFEGLPSPVGAALVTLPAVSVHLSLMPIYLPLVILVMALSVSRIPYLHNQASRHTFLGKIHLPTFICFVLSMVSLLPGLPVGDTPLRFIAIHGFFGFILIYVLSPLLLRNKS